MLLLVFVFINNYKDPFFITNFNGYLLNIPKNGSLFIITVIHSYAPKFS